MSTFQNILLKFSSVQLLATVIKIISGFVIIKLLLPEIFGLFSGVNIYLGYILLLNFGVINGLSRDLPFFTGKSRYDKVNSLSSSVFVINCVISLSVFLVFLFFSVKFYIEDNQLNSILYMGFSIIALLHISNKQFFPVLYRTNNDFNHLSKIYFYSSILGLFSLVFIYFYGLFGLLLRTIILSIFDFILLFHMKPVELKLKIDFQDVYSLFKTGIPIFFVGELNPLWYTLIGTIIINFLGPTEMGLFAFCLLILNSIMVIPSSISQVIYPRMAIMLGSGKSIKEILNFSKAPLLWLFIFLVFFSTFSALVVPTLISIFLENYSDAVSASIWILLIPIFLAFSPLNSIYNVMKKQKLYILALLSGIVLGTIYMITRIYLNGYSLEFVTQGILLGIIFQQIISLSLIKYLYK